MIFRAVILSALLALPVSLAAGPATVAACHQSMASGAQNLMMPADRSIRLFANGRVRLLWLDVEEPACCSSYLMVVLPAGDEPGEICRVVSADGSLGFGGMDLPGAVAGYDPATGLSVSIPVNIWEGDGPPPKTLVVNINQATGGVLAATFP